MPLTIQLGNQKVSVQTGYCTNVHAGKNLETVFANLREFSLPVQEAMAKFRLENTGASYLGDSLLEPKKPDETLGLGLWFSETSVREALEPENLAKLKDYLATHRIRPYTLNGFPQSDFHQLVVKHQVYLPTWFEPSRLEYTQQLIQLLDNLLPAGEMGSISTLPIGWGHPALTETQIEAVTRHWLELAKTLHRLKEETGRTILVAVEPEPGCAFTDSPSYRKFFTEQFLPRLSNERERDLARSYITLCHDVCHAAVMYENQASELQQFFDLGMRVGKVQVSSAVDVDWSNMPPELREVAWSQLRNFVENRYLHQVHIQSGSTPQSGSNPSASNSAARPLTMIDDLPEAFAQYSAPPTSGQWRVHFHVPIYLPTLDALRTTQTEINKTLAILLPKVGSEQFPTGHFEVETYAWTVLPEHLHAPNLSHGIALELQWFEKLLQTYNSPDASIGLPC